jgi:hypothetical protein
VVLGGRATLSDAAETVVPEALAPDVKARVSPEQIDRHSERMRTDTARYALGEADLNRLGYHAVNSWRDVPGAIAVFRLNVRAFPKSGNVYDSLGEAHLAQGDTVRARANRSSSTPTTATPRTS